MAQKKPNASERIRAWLGERNMLACAIIGVLAALACVGLFLFTVFSGFGGSADFIYNQF